MIATFLTLFVLPILYILVEKGIKVKPNIIVTLLFFITFITVPSKAQVPINLRSAIDTALKNNLSIKNEKLRSDYQKKTTRSYANIPQAGIIGEYGQINSFYNDNRFGISQSFNFPPYIPIKRIY